MMDARARVQIRTRVFTLRVTESIRKIAGQRRRKSSLDSCSR